MSKITISADFAREIHVTLSKGVSKDTYKYTSGFRDYLFACDGEKLTAVCGDSFSVRSITGAVLPESDVCEMRVPVFGKIDKKAETITFESSGEGLKIISLLTGGSRNESIISDANLNAPFLERWREILKKPDGLKIETRVNPKLGVAGYERERCRNGNRRR